MQEVKHVPISTIRPNPRQPRKHFDELELQALAASIKERKIIQPLVVEKCTGGYILVAGERRWRAAQIANLPDVPVIIREGTSTAEELLVDALIENLHRQDMNVVEEGEAFRVLIEEMKLSVQKAALKLGINRARLDNGLMFASADEEIKQLLIGGKLPTTPGVTRALMQIPNKEQRIALAKDIAARRLTVKGCIAAANKMTEMLAASALSSDKTRKDRKPPALVIVNHRHRFDEMKWNAAKQLGRVPQWGLVDEATRNTCENCVLADMANEQTCGDCPMVILLTQLMEATHDDKR